MSKKKNQILEVATKLFAEQGFENTSVTNICETANVSKGLVYHHFKSKESILIEIYTSSTDRMVALSEEFNKSLAPNIQIIQLIKSIFSQLENDRMFFQMNLNIMFQPSTKEILHEQIKERSTILFESVKRIFDKISPSRSTILSYVFIAEIDGVALNYLSVFEDYPLDTLIEHLIAKYESIQN